MFREKLLMRTASKTFILIDESKMVSRLGERCPVPVEVYPEALHFVKHELHRLSADEVALRPARGKDGPVITENGNFIVDARFSTIPPTLEQDIKAISGVIESGLFIGYDVEVMLPGA
jgi:ribose 5-phosphate isomerase A